MNRILAITGLAMCVVGCAASLTPEQQVQQQAQLRTDAAKPILCVKGNDCDDKWGRALTWVSQTSAYKIHTLTDNLIQTYTPTGGSASSGFRVNKIPLGKGRFQITMASECDNFIGCIPGAMRLKADFTRYVIGSPGGDQPATEAVPVTKLGFDAAPVSPRLARLLKLEEVGGMRVTAVNAGSVASRSGLKRGDIILTYGDTTISTDPEQLRAAVAATPPGRTVPITIWREQSQLTLTVQF